MPATKRALILSVGYGEGHHAAARALKLELEGRGYGVQMCDPCSTAHPRIFEITRRFYHLCVRRMPWLWGVTYAQTDTADWSLKAHSPILSDVTECIAELVREFKPQYIVCTYPLFAHMLDTLTREGRVTVPYAVIVTDSIEISRPWMVTQAPLICLQDEHSRRLVCERYALSSERIVATGFPVRREFSAYKGRRCVPDSQNLRLVYGAYAPLNRVRSDLAALVKAWPSAYITVIAGERCSALADFNCDRVSVIRRTDDMPTLFSESHFYIGKAGAATMFEAYSSELPVIVNYSLPGQEQGNLALLLADGAGVTAGTTSELLTRVRGLLADGAAGWKRLTAAMQRAARTGAAARIVDELERRFNV